MTLGILPQYNPTTGYAFQVVRVILFLFSKNNFHKYSIQMLWKAAV